MHIDTPEHAYPPRWSTASFGDEADPSPAEIATLGAHLNWCRDRTVRLDALQAAASSLRGLVAARFVTTLLVVSLVSALIMAL